ncbi:MAG: GGDEF domain-containing protein [Oscillospiraceae bacterium]|nr:GGDEF domain-containing protein [Oscillospiraceae bacterium]
MNIKAGYWNGGDKMEQPPQIKGIHISRMHTAIIIISCVLSMLLTATAYYVSSTLHDTYTAIDDFAVCTQTENSFIAASDYLTEQVRLYIVTGQQEYVDNYFQETLEVRRREAAIEALSGYDLKPETIAALQSALDRSNALMEQEIYAICLTAAALDRDMAVFPQAVQEAALTDADQVLTSDEMKEKASGLVFGAAYQAAKSQIKSDMDYSLTGLNGTIQDRMEGGYASFQGAMHVHRIFIGVHFAATLAGFLFTILLVVLPVTSFVRRIKAGETLRVVGAYECKCLAHTYNAMFAKNAAQEDQLRHQAEHDALTGLLNRGAFDALQQALSQENRPVGLLIVDVDKFKQVNDGCGHAMGDKVLQKVADLLTENFQSIGKPARIGGDEFAVILTGAGQEKESEILEKIHAINQTLTHPAGKFPVVSLSVGGAFSEAGFSGNLYKRADLALYEVKEHGRCGCRFYAGQELPV